MPSQPHLTAVCLATLGLALAPAAVAQDKLYDVELIIFENLQPAPGGAENEHWPDQPGQPELSGARGLRSWGGRPAPYSRLPADRHQLDSAYRALSDSDNYSPLIHLAWVQPGQPRNAAQAVHIRDSELVEPPSDQPGIADSEYLYRLDGTVTVSLGRYLHVDTDLLFAEVVEPEATAPPGGPDSDRTTRMDAWQPALGPELRRYGMKQTRRLRSEELHYLDHPRFGLLVRIRPH